MWSRFDQKVNSNRGISISCVQETINTKLLINYWNACREYTKCGALLKQEGKSQSYIDNGPCKTQYQNVMKFHEAMRATIEGCAVSTEGQKN